MTQLLKLLKNKDLVRFGSFFLRVITLIYSLLLAFLKNHVTHTANQHLDKTKGNCRIFVG